MGYDEAPQDMGYFAEAPFEGYVRERDTSARVVPLENIGGVEGYYRPQTINPSFESFRPPEEGTSQHQHVVSTALVTREEKAMAVVKGVKEKVHLPLTMRSRSKLGSDSARFSRPTSCGSSRTSRGRPSC